jgi:hypothetical protein
MLVECPLLEEEVVGVVVLVDLEMYLLGEELIKGVGVV